MARVSAGLIGYRRSKGVLEVLLVHPGGPFWKAKDLGAWSIPKGALDAGEEALEGAKREFREETGFTVVGPCIPLASLRQPGGKLVHAWAVAGDWDPSALRSNMASIVWPPRSDRTLEFPEVDRAAWFPIHEARRRIAPGQVGFLDELVGLLEQHRGAL
ncbi:MAG TPA: NUDIX domain-containing protein [Gemmatimonadales bacterium]|nr:NUDIX domain-containing protein [Gemmatimonadales bacterium]